MKYKIESGKLSEDNKYVVLFGLDLRDPRRLLWIDHFGSGRMNIFFIMNTLLENWKAVK